MCRCPLHSRALRARLVRPQDTVVSGLEASRRSRHGRCCTHHRRATMRKLLMAVLGGLAILTLGSGVASAVPFDVFALTHSTEIAAGVVQGTGLATGLF